MVSAILVIFLNLLIIVKSDITTPTSGNATHEYFIASEYGLPYFQWQNIICSAFYCHIICDQQSSCYHFSVQVTPDVKLFTLECLNERACVTDNIINIPTVSEMNLICDYSTSNKTKAACYNLELNASQPDINTNVTINCIGTNSCYLSRFYLSYAGQVSMVSSGSSALGSIDLYVENINNDLSILCPGWYSCSNMDIFANYSTGAIDMSCTGRYSCRYFDLYALQGSSDVYIACDGDSSSSIGVYECQGIEVYCPMYGTCEMWCFQERSCWAAQYYVSNEEYEGFKTFCPMAYEDACSYVDINCLDTGLQSTLFQQYDNSWGCENFACCPTREGGPRKCDPGVPCSIRCSGLTSCRNKIINATTATSLTLICSTGENCAGSLILCPTGDNTSCIIENECSEAVIVTGDGNAMDNFALTCGVDDCQYLDVSFTSISINNVEINCLNDDACRGSTFAFLSESIENVTILCGRDDRACYGTTFNVTSNVNNFELICQEDGCRGTNIIISSNINNLVWNCLQSQGCYQSVFTLADGAMVDSFNWICTTAGNIASTSTIYGACEMATLSLSDNALINDFSMEIDSGCIAANVTAKVTSTGVITCGGEKGCDSSEISLIATNKDVNFDINCYNLGLTSNADNGACVNSVFNIYGYQGSDINRYNNLSALCGQRDCYHTYFNGYNLNTLSGECPAPYSCSSVRFIADESDKLDVSCPNTGSCQSAIIYCPYLEENSCKITCSDKTKACANTHIYVPDSYQFGYLDIECPIPTTTSIITDGPCYGLDFECLSGGRENVEYIYNETNQIYKCQDETLTACCPYFGGNTIDTSIDENIICDDITNKCDSQLIDGSNNNNYLTINCTINSGCRDSVIICPINGCSINCLAQYSCSDITVIYRGELNDNGKMNINCYGDYSCINGLIEANYINEINIECISNDISSYPDKTCSSMIFNTQYANNVIVNVRGSYAFTENELRGINVNRMEINLISNMDSSGYGATSQNNWYISQNTSISCWGYGCVDLSSIYRGNYIQSSSDLSINIESCGQCFNFMECINTFQLLCNSGKMDEFINNQLCVNNTNNCGCLDIISSYSYLSSYNEPNCYTPYTTLTPTAITNSPSSNPSQIGDTKSPSRAPLGMDETRSPTMPTMSPETSNNDTPSPVISTNDALIIINNKLSFLFLFVFYFFMML